MDRHGGQGLRLSALSDELRSGVFCAVANDFAEGCEKLIEELASISSGLLQSRLVQNARSFLRLGRIRKADILYWYLGKWHEMVPYATGYDLYHAIELVVGSHEYLRAFSFLLEPQEETTSTNNYQTQSVSEPMVEATGQVTSSVSSQPYQQAVGTSSEQVQHSLPTPPLSKHHNQGMTACSNESALPVRNQLQSGTSCNIQGQRPGLEFFPAPASVTEHQSVPFFQHLPASGDLAETYSQPTNLLSHEDQLGSSRTSSPLEYLNAAPSKSGESLMTQFEALTRDQSCNPSPTKCLTDGMTEIMVRDPVLENSLQEHLSSSQGTDPTLPLNVHTTHSPTTPPNQGGGHQKRTAATTLTSDMPDQNQEWSEERQLTTSRQATVPAHGMLTSPEQHLEEAVSGKSTVGVLPSAQTGYNAVNSMPVATVCGTSPVTYRKVQSSDFASHETYGSPSLAATDRNTQPLSATTRTSLSSSTSHVCQEVAKTTSTMTVTHPRSQTLKTAGPASSAQPTDQMATSSAGMTVTPSAGPVSSTTCTSPPSVGETKQSAIASETETTQVDWLRLLSALCVDIKDMNTCTNLAIQLQITTDPKDNLVYRLHTQYPYDPASIARELFRAWLGKEDIFQLNNDQKKETLTFIFNDILTRNDLTRQMEELIPRFRISMQHSPLLGSSSIDVAEQSVESLPLLS